MFKSNSIITEDPMKVNLSNNWSVIQDVQNMGETFQIWNPMFNPTDTFFSCISDWQPIDRLSHLQNLFAASPYSGRELRHFNASPWWYKTTFELSKEDSAKNAVLRFEAIDYFSKIYLNGELLGEHEGYFTPAEFETEGKLVAGTNTIVVKVWSPFDDELISIKQGEMEVAPLFRFLSSKKDMIKGTYDHADGFFQRDVNPIGIYGEVSLEFYELVHFDGEMNIESYDNGSSVSVTFSVPVYSCSVGNVSYSFAIQHPITGETVYSSTGNLMCETGHNEIIETVKMDNPLFWTIWDRGTPNLYTINFSVGNEKSITKKFGIRTIEVLRDENTTAFVLNGKQVFLRGTSYYPDVYLSRMTKERYLSDLHRIKEMGFNSVRVHVHVARPVFYELCDEIGLAVIQDSDISWFHNTTEQFTKRALEVFSAMVKMLRYHPSIICWVAMNEPDMWIIAERRGWIKLDEHPISMMKDRPGPQLIEYLKKNDPLRPFIKGSQFEDDSESGDTHDYTGSISDGNSHYYDNYGKKYKLLTEFGMDMPAVEESLRSMPKYHERIKKIYEDKDAYIDLVEYRTLYLKYMTEYCRIQKGNPCSGYFQFLFSDVSPQSQYGLQDWWGLLKEGAQYCYESNQPVGIFLEHSAEGLKGVWAVNDTPTYIESCTVIWSIVSKNDCVSKRITVDLMPDNAVSVCEISFTPEENKNYDIFLSVFDSSGKQIAHNKYINVFKKTKHPDGHPMRIDHELGMRLFWA